MNKIPVTLAVLLGLGIFITIGSGQERVEHSSRKWEWNVSAENVQVRRAAEEEIPQSVADTSDFFVCSADITNNSVRNIDFEYDIDIQAVDGQSFAVGRYHMDRSQASFKPEPIIPPGCASHTDMMFIADMNHMNTNEVELVIGRYSDNPCVFGPYELPE